MSVKKRVSLKRLKSDLKRKRLESYANLAGWLLPDPATSVPGATSIERDSLSQHNKVARALLERALAQYEQALKLQNDITNSAPQAQVGPSNIHIDSAAASSWHFSVALSSLDGPSCIRLGEAVASFGRLSISDRAALQGELAAVLMEVFAGLPSSDPVDIDEAIDELDPAMKSGPTEA